MSPPWRSCEAAGTPYCLGRRPAGTTSPKSSRFYHTGSICSRDSGPLHHQSESFANGFIISKDCSYIGSLQDQFRYDRPRAPRPAAMPSKWVWANREEASSALRTAFPPAMLGPGKGPKTTNNTISAPNRWAWMVAWGSVRSANPEPSSGTRMRL